MRDFAKAPPPPLRKRNFRDTGAAHGDGRRKSLGAGMWMPVTRDAFVPPALPCGGQAAGFSPAGAIAISRPLLTKHPKERGKYDKL